MAVRNFWINVSVDGKKNDIATGPRSKNGGMQINLFLRQNGQSKKAITILCTEDSGQLLIDVQNEKKQTVYTVGATK